MKLSVIVPVYNVEHYLERCVNSLLSQDLKNNEYEIILVDDGSTDNSAFIVNKLTNKIPNVKAIYKNNGGLSSARNAGVDVAKGDYLMFVDSDDYLERNVLGTLYHACKANNLDVCHFKMSVMKSDGNFFIDEFKNYNYNQIYNGFEVIREGSMIGSVCSNIYDHTIFKKNNLRFYEGITHEDVEFTSRLFCYVSRFMLLDICPYVYFFNPLSLSADTKIEKKTKYIYDEIIVSFLIRRFAESLSDYRIKRILNKRCNSSIVGRLIYFLRDKSIPKSVIESFIDLAKEYQEYPIKGKTLSWKTNLIKPFLNNEKSLQFLLNIIL